MNPRSAAFAEDKLRGGDMIGKFGASLTRRYGSRERTFAAFFIVVCAALLLPRTGSAAPSSKATLEQVGNQVYCQCGGCVTMLNHCPHLQCATRTEMQAAILKGISKGESDPAILQDLTRQYGVRVLAAPPAAGFDLAVWVLPGIGLIIGLAIVVTIVRRWRREPPSEPAPNAPPAPDARIMAAVEEEMNKF